MWNSPDILMHMCQISTSCITQWSQQTINPHWAALQRHQNSPALTPPAFSSMAAEPVKCSYLDWSSPPTGCPALASSTYPSPFSLSTGEQRAKFQCNHRRTQTQWRCPPHGLLNNTGIHTLGKPTGFRHTALLASLFSFLIALPLFSSTVPSLHLSLSPQDCLCFWKSSPSLAEMKQTTSAAGGLLQHPHPLLPPSL